MKEFSLPGQRALITGGGTGIGLGIARALVRAGAEVILTGRRAEPLAAAVAELGSRAAYRVYDVTDLGRAEDLVADLEAACGPLHILVNNAGNHHKRPSAEVPAADFREVLDVHLTGAHDLTSAVGRRLLERGGGVVLFVASMASLFGIPQVAAYAAAKSGILGLVRTLATEWGPQGVRVNALAPGWIDSDIMRRALDGDPERAGRILGRTPLGRFGTAEDVGWAAVFLCSPAARYITGVCLPVDGGTAIGF